MSRGIKLNITLAMLKAVRDAFGHLDQHQKIVLKQTRCRSGTYRASLFRLKKQGLLTAVEINGERFLKLTKTGELRTLVLKAALNQIVRWDGKFRLIVFDIPERARFKRNELRKLLKQCGYRQLQASVFINPYPLNRQAIEYLKEKHLMDYIRIMKIEEMDDDTDLRIKFNLKK